MMKHSNDSVVSLGLLALVLLLDLNHHLDLHATEWGVSARACTARVHLWLGVAAGHVHTEGELSNTHCRACMLSALAKELHEEFYVRQVPNLQHLPLNAHVLIRNSAQWRPE